MSVYTRGQREKDGEHAVFHYGVHLQYQGIEPSLFRPFFLDVGQLPAAIRVSIQFHMVSYCSAIKFNIFEVTSHLLISTIVAIIQLALKL